MMVTRTDSGGLETTWLGKLALGLIILALGGGLNIMIAKIDAAVTRDDVAWLRSEGRTAGDSFTKRDGENMDYRIRLLEERQRLLELWVAQDKVMNEEIKNQLQEAKAERQQILKLIMSGHRP